MRIQSKTLVVCTEKRFSINLKNKIVNEDNTRTFLFWDRYLEVFDKIIVVARVDTKHKVDSNNFVENSKVEVYPVTNFQGLNQTLVNMYKVKGELRQLIEKYNYASFILRAPGTIANLLGSLLKKEKLLYSIEVVGDPYDVFSAQKGFFSKVIAIKEKRSLQKLLKHAQYAAYVTEYALQKRYPFYGAWQTHYSSINLNDDFFKETKDYNQLKLKIIGIGNLEVNYKGVDFLLEALNNLNKKGINFELEWIGGGKLLNEYKNFSDSNGLTTKVSFKGSQPYHKIPDYLNNNNIFILSSLQEGLPRVLIEAMASRLICIGTDVGGVSELLNDNCIIKPGDANAIAEKLLDVSRSFNKYLNYTDEHYLKAKQYLPEVLRNRRVKFYTKICNKS